MLAYVREQDAGSASGVLNTGFQLGNSIGLALMDVVLVRPARNRGQRPGLRRCGRARAVVQVGVFGLAFLLSSPCQPDAVTTSPRHPSESTAPNTRGE